LAQKNVRQLLILPAETAIIDKVERTRPRRSRVASARHHSRIQSRADLQSDRLLEYIKSIPMKR